MAGDGSVIDQETFEQARCILDQSNKSSTVRRHIYTITTSVKNSRTRAHLYRNQNSERTEPTSSKPAGTASIGEVQEDDKVLVAFSATACDPDSNEITYEWDGRTSEDTYAVGSTYTVMVRDKDNVSVAYCSHGQPYAI